MNITMKKIINIKFSFLIVLLTLSNILHAQDNNLISDTIPQLQVDKDVNLIFNTMTKRKTTGSVTVIDVEKELKSDMSGNFFQKVPGMFGTSNVWGTGDAIVVVDGIPREGSFLMHVSALEVESIVVMKDALSKAMYGAAADQGVILMTTKRGLAGEHKLRVLGQVNTMAPRALPNYLDAGDYMEKYNMAQLNDGVDPASLAYSQQTIDATRSGENPARYPDNDFYTTDYLKEYTNQYSVFADLSGGSEKARYYMSSSWDRSNGFLNAPQSDVIDVMKFRGNLDFFINKYMTMGIDAFASVDQNQQPNAGNYFNRFATIKPNDYPELWDPSIIVNDELRLPILNSANLVDGQLLGGNASFLDNMMGDMTQNGNTKLMRRNLQFSGKLDVDLSFITQGLSAKGYAGMQFYNSLYTRQETNYAVYQPLFDDITGEVIDVTIHGKDEAANKYHAQNDLSDFYRQTSYYGTLNYNRSFGAHDISAVAMINGNQYAWNGKIQNTVALTTGVSANYMYANKYIAEVSVMGVGSRKLSEGSRMEMAPSFGLGWVLSEEGFMSGDSFFDYLKLRGSYGISKNDISRDGIWDDYYLYKETFTRGASFQYGNRNYRNSETAYASIANDIMLQERRDITVGLDATLLNKAMNVELGYFNSASLGNITEMTDSYPQILGYETLVYNNYDSDVTQGIEFGLNYTQSLSSDLIMTAGASLLHISPEITKREEPKYEGEDAALLRTGTATDAMWALLSDGLYSDTDFNADGSLVAGLPVSTYGDVKPGDIKYLDQNGDGVINQLDQRIVGNGQRTQYNLYLDLRYKNFELYVLGTGYAGDANYRSGSYYRVFGNGKYSEMANDAWNPNSPNVNAMHPRLSTTNSDNNNRNSDYWLYKNNRFTIPTMQLTYHFDGGTKFDFLKNSRIYARGGNLFRFGKNKKYTEVIEGIYPTTKSLQIGFVTSF